MKCQDVQCQRTSGVTHGMHWTRLSCDSLSARRYAFHRLTDWFFAGDWIHLALHLIPEIWRRDDEVESDSSDQSATFR